jgi:hypothetical protein
MSIRLLGPLVLFAAVSVFATDPVNGSSEAAVSHAAEQRFLKTIPQLPLRFEANVGQSSAGVRFVARGSGYILLFKATEIAIATVRPELQPTRANLVKIGDFHHKHQTIDLIRARFLSAGAPHLYGTGELSGKSNYFIGDDPSRWHLGVPNFASLVYHDLYPGVDVVYYGNHGQLENDFLIAPGNRIGTIRLRIDGTRKIKVDHSGNLLISLRVGEIRLFRPFAYQEIDGVRQEVAAGYVLYSRKSFGFKVAAYDIRKTLVIDPTLVYSTYLGGTGNDFGTAIAVGSDGASYVAGYTTSVDFPISAAAVQPAIANGSYNAFVTKINSSGTEIVYSTFFGGPTGQTHLPPGTGAQAIAVDANGNAYITGTTISIDFPTTPGAYQANFRGGFANPPPFGILGDAFVTKINEAGNALLYSTYLGGSSFDIGLGIAVDSTGNAYVVGTTNSGDFPTTSGAFQPSYGGGLFDAFVTKVNSSGTGLIYSSFLGGNDLEVYPPLLASIAVDASGSAYVTSSTTSSNFPITAGAFDSTQHASEAAFVAKFSPDGSALAFSTLLGGGDNDYSTAIALDQEGNSYITGSASSNNFPVVPGAFQSVLAGSRNAFISKLNNAGSALVYSTYLGGSGSDVGQGIGIDSSGDAYVTGVTSSSDFPVQNPIQSTLRGPNDAFAAIVNPNGTTLLFATFVGAARQIVARVSQSIRHVPCTLREARIPSISQPLWVFSRGLRKRA